MFSGPQPQIRMSNESARPLMCQRYVVFIAVYGAPECITLRLREITLSFHPRVAPGVSATVAPILCVSSPSQSACNYPTEMPNQEKGNLIKSELKDFKDLRDRLKYKLIAGAVLFL